MTARSLTRVGAKRIRPIPADPPTHAELSDWADAEIYKVWCASAAELLKALRADHTDHAMTTAEARRHLLAEIERRHPRATAAWLASDAILYGEPPRFLLHNT